MWIAKKRMKIVRGKSTVWVDPGDPVPEASTWANPSAWERQGFIRKIRRGEGEPPVKVAVTAAMIIASARRPAPIPVEKAEPPPEVESVEPTDTDTDTDTDTEPTPAPALMKKEPLTGKGKCPYCKKAFLRLERHKCKRMP